MIKSHLYHHHYLKIALGLVLTFFGFAGLGFLMANMRFYIEEGQYYSIGFEDGANTFTDDELVAMTIKDSLISIYGIIPTALNSTTLTDGSEQSFDSRRVSFINESSQLDQADYTAGGYPV